MSGNRMQGETFLQRPRTPAYEAGINAYRSRLKFGECPEATPSDRYDWFNGWLDARTADVLGHVWKKWGILWI